jgi:hypothetical protein
MRTALESVGGRDAERRDDVVDIEVRKWLYGTVMG